MRAPSRRRDEKGAIAVMTVILSVVIFGAAAIAIDISMLAMERQKLHDAVDAAAHAGAYAMPGDGATAIKAARDMALANDPDLIYDFTEQNPQIRLWCLVASTGTSTSVRTDQIPSTCNPGPRRTRPRAIPTCGATPGSARSRVRPASRPPATPWRWWPRRTWTSGSPTSSGAARARPARSSSAACKGSCGQEAPNPLDVVFMADRTTVDERRRPWR